VVSGRWSEKRSNAPATAGGTDWRSGQWSVVSGQGKDGDGDEGKRGMGEVGKEERGQATLPDLELTSVEWNSRWSKPAIAGGSSL
jgi:hypothetical protein